MSKCFTLCLSLLMAGTTMANADNDKLSAYNPLKRNAAWRPVTVQGMNKRTATTMQLQRLRQATANKASLDNGFETPGYGWVMGPDETQWFYTQTYELSGMYYSKSVITVYDNNGQQVGQVTVDAPEGENVNRIEVYGNTPITKKMFDRNDNTYEMLVELHIPGDDSNNYTGKYLTRAYSLDGTLVAEFDGSGVLFDASKDWNTYQRLLMARTATAAETSDKNMIAIDVIAPPGWNEDKPKVEHTFLVADSLQNYGAGSYFNCYVVDDQPYYIISHYAKRYEQNPDDWYNDIIPTEDNSYVLKVYDKKFNLVDSLGVPLDKGENTLYRFAGFGMMSDNDMSDGYFTEKGKKAYVITYMDYVTSMDDYVYEFVVFDGQGNKLNTICDNVYQEWFDLSPIRGKSDQMMFLQTKGSSSAQQIQMVNLPSCEKATLIPSDIDGISITTELDRYPVGDSYQYVIKTAQADTDSEGNTIARIGWYTTEPKLDHMVTFNLGSNGEYFTPLLNNQTLDPYLFNGDDKMEYIYIAKKKRTDGSEKVDNVLEIANEDGEVIRSFVGDDTWKLREPSVVAITPTKSKLFISLYNDETEDYKISFYDLPFTKLNNGGDGTAANPYLVSTVGDMLQITNEPAAHYKLANDIDFAKYKSYWTPVANTFTGSLDGDGHAIANLSINTDEARAALFATAGEGSKITNISFVNPTVTVNADNMYVGVVAGEAATDTLSNVHVYNATIAAADNDDSDITPSVGGLVGRAVLYSRAEACSFDGTISMPASSLLGGIGGIYGETLTSSTVASCAMSGSISAMSNVGGIVGSQGTASPISDCHVNAALTAQNSVGGIVGANGSRAIIDRCVAEGTITATKAKWSGLSAGGIAGKIESNWTSSKDTVIANCVSAADIVVSDEDVATDQTVHRIVGYTIANEEDSKKVEGGLVNNYALSTVKVGSTTVSSDDATSVEGASKGADELAQTLFETLGYAYGDNVKAPWKDASLPLLFFENTPMALTLSATSVTMEKESTADIYATVYGAAADAVDCQSEATDIAEVEVVAAEDNVATLRITAKAEGQATITVTAGERTYTISVTVTDASAISNITAQALAIRLADGTVSVDGASKVTLYSVDGKRAAAANGSVVSTATLPSGVYVVVATGDNAMTKTAKVVVK